MLALELTSLQLTPLEAECCNNDWEWKYCDEWCCGCGPCNIFCCNCDNGCNLSWWRRSHERGFLRLANDQRCHHKRDIIGSSGNSSLAAETYFRTIDSDGDRAITLDEAEVYLKNQTKFKRNLGVFCK